MQLLSMIISFVRVCWPLVLASSILLRFIRNYLKLRHVPGPFLAGITDLWRVVHTLRGATMKEYELHRRYDSPLLRLGPNTVSVSDPTAIRVIYGLNPIFQKVWCPCPWGRLQMI